MKKQAHRLLLLLLLPLLTSCPDNVDPLPDSAYTPVLMSRQQLEASIAQKEPRAIVKPGKLYRYRHYILINELYKGVHIIDNQNPKSPVNVAFIQVPGCVDMAVKENVLYVDNAVDLVAISLGDVNNLQVTSRVRNALPELPAPDNMQVWYGKGGAPEDAVVVGWELRKSE